MAEQVALRRRQETEEERRKLLKANGNLKQERKYLLMFTNFTDHLSTGCPQRV
jgi:hypothetical protein